MDDIYKKYSHIVSAFIETVKDYLENSRLIMDASITLVKRAELNFEPDVNEWYELGYIQEILNKSLGLKTNIRDAILELSENPDKRELRRILKYKLPTMEEIEEQVKKAAIYKVVGSQHNGTIKDVKDKNDISIHLIQGKDSGNSPSILKAGSRGGNNTYRVGYPEVNRYIFLVVKFKYLPYQWVDIRNHALSVNNRERINDQFITDLYTLLKNISAIFKVLPNTPDEIYRFELADPSILKL